MTNEELTMIYHSFIEDTTNIFNYLNDRIVKVNKCVLNIAYFSNANYGQFQYPNIITVFLGSIIASCDLYNDPKYLRDYILSVISLVVAHEMHHADQLIDSYRYANDIEYAKNIENAAEYNAELFCVSHKREMKRLFNFDMLVKKTNMFGIYERTTPSNIYGQMILGIFRNASAYEKFNKCINEFENVDVLVAFKDGYKDMMTVKSNGVMCDKYIMEFADMLMNMRKGISSCDYKFSSFIHSDREDYAVFVIHVVDYTYKPFIID